VNKDELKFNLLRQIAENPDSSQRELAVELGVSLGSVNYCLKALIDVGWVKMGNFTRSQDKKNYAYLLTPEGVAEKTALTLRFLKRKQAEYEVLGFEIKVLKSEAAE
jgi:EPS-associated MarR family transcriptional regulator